MNENVVDTVPIPEEPAFIPPMNPVANTVEKELAIEPAQAGKKDVESVLVKGRPNPVSDEKQKSGEAFLEGFNGADLWDQIKKYTKCIELSDVNDYCWLEKRTLTQKAIDDLFAKRILFIHSSSEDWLYPAVLRLSTVLQAGGVPGNVLLRITKDKLSGNGTKDILKFGFWENQRPLPFPVIVFISAHRQDFIQKLLELPIETLKNQVLADLRRLNLFLVIEIGEKIQSEDYRTILRKRLHETLAIWEIPCIRLHVAKCVGTKAEWLIERLTAEEILMKNDQRGLYERLLKTDLNAAMTEPDQFFENLKDLGSDFEEKQKQLVQIVEGEDFLHQVVVFCGAFFDGLYYPDFFRLVKTLLLDTKEINQAHIQPNDSGANSDKRSNDARLLTEMWEKNASRILKACFIETKRDGGNNRIGFTLSKLPKALAHYFEYEQYPFFFRLYGNFAQAGLLTDPYLNERLEPFVVRFFSIAAKMDTSTHDARWLKDIVHSFWSCYENNLPKSNDYDDLMRFLRHERALAPIVFTRLPLIISGLLRNSNEQYKEIVREFFRLLLKEPDAKKIAVIIASHLFREFHQSELFPIKDLISYFCRTLDEGNSGDSFFAYDALAESMDYRTLREETKRWIDDPDTSEDSRTKQFAFLYQVDFVLETVYRYFRQFKGEEPYELWDMSNNKGFPAQFEELLKDLVSESSLKSLADVFASNEGNRHFFYQARLFERVELNKPLRVYEHLLSRKAAPFVIVADVLETWFYILTHKENTLRFDSTVKESWKVFVQLVNKHINNNFKTFRVCWAEKLKSYTAELDIQKKQNSAVRSIATDYTDNILKRRNSLKMFVQLLQAPRRITT